MTPRELEELCTFIEKNLAWEEQSKVAAPVLFQEKEDGLLCVCVDYRGLNSVCAENMYLLPLTKDMLDHLSKGRIFSK